MDSNKSDKIETTPKPTKDSDSPGPHRKKMKPIHYNECFPISSLDHISQVLENPPGWIGDIQALKPRSGTAVQNTISDCHVDLKKFVPKQRFDTRFVPKTLVCHDYKGGYLEDKHLSKVNRGNLYSFYNWAHIDIFVYFSHHLITIPPLCWINAAHRHGVKILGTFITEGTAGAKICEKFLADEDTMRIFATSLVQIMKVFQFDGWLLNIENALTGTEMLKKFVTYLTVSVHRVDGGNLVIWYDSVIESGALKWQNELNPLNKCFFDVCDGIFLNYVWTEQQIKNSVDFAKHRSLDVFVGVDVFGRNTFGGGQFNCYKAAQIIRRYNLSMAIFAPGWVHETLPNIAGEEIIGIPSDLNTTFEDFVNRDCAFWNHLWPYLYTHPVTELFRTSFFIGVNKEIYDLSSQHQQLSKIKHPQNTSTVPNFTEITTLNNKCKCLQTSYSENGAIECQITKEFMNSSLFYVHQLFVCDIHLSGSYRLFYVTKRSRDDDTPAASLSLNLLTVNKNGAVRKIKCNSDRKEELVENLTLMEVNPSEDVSLSDYVRSSVDSEMFETNAIDLQIHIYKFTITHCNLLEIGAVLDKGKSIKLCAFGIEEQ